MTRLEKKERFIRTLAKYLVADQGLKSIELMQRRKHAEEWRDLRAATPLFGYPTEDEAYEQLREFLL